MILEKEYQELKQFLLYTERLNEKISARGVDWHLDHSLKVIIQIVNHLKESKPQDYRADFNWLRMGVFLIGKIPRGKGKSPDTVNHKGKITISELEIQLKEAHQLLQEIEQLPPKCYVNHPVFGVLNRSQTIRFLQIHTRHHVELMNDIIQ